MTSGVPWSVKGINPRAREIAKDLARRDGMTLGGWINKLIACKNPVGRRRAPDRVLTREVWADGDGDAAIRSASFAAHGGHGPSGGRGEPGR